MTVNGTASSERSWQLTWAVTTRRSVDASSSDVAPDRAEAATERTRARSDGASNDREVSARHQSASASARASDGPCARKAALSAPAEQPNSASGNTPVSASATRQPAW